MTIMTAEERPGRRIKDRPEIKTKPKPLCFPPAAKVRNAVAEMTRLNYGSVIVTDDDGHVLGVVTERDLTRRIIDEGRDPAETRLDDIMTAEPRVAREDDDLVDWLRMMSNERFRRLPVVDDEGRIKAVLTQGDFVSYTWPDLLYQGRQIARATISRNFGLVLVGGALLLWVLAMMMVVGAVA